MISTCPCHNPCDYHHFGDDLSCDFCDQTWRDQQHEPCHCPRGLEHYDRRAWNRADRAKRKAEEAQL